MIRVLRVKMCTSTGAKTSPSASARPQGASRGQAHLGSGAIRTRRRHSRPLKARHGGPGNYSRLPELAAAKFLAVENQNVGKQVHKKNVEKKKKL